MGFVVSVQKSAESVSVYIFPDQISVTLDDLTTDWVLLYHEYSFCFLLIQQDSALPCLDCHHIVR